MTTSEYFLTLNEKGEAVLLTEAHPAHELTEDQVGLTRDEFKLMEALKGDIGKARKLIQSIEKKIKEHMK